MGDFFGGAGRRTRARRGADLQYDLEIDFEDAIFGFNTEIQFPRSQPCDECHGTGAAGRRSTADLQSVRRSRPGSLPAGILLRRQDVPSVPRRG